MFWYGFDVLLHLLRYTPEEWLGRIEEHYFAGRDDLVRNTIQGALDNVEDRFSLVIHIMNRGFFDLYAKRVPIIWATLDETDIWMENRVG